jgi:RNA-directed DNA polymerase
MPLGNLTSQFFANVYLNELDYFVKHELRAKYYIRYVDDFVLLSSSKEQLRKWKKKIEIFLLEKLKLKLHPDKSKIINLSKGIDFVGFRNFYHYKLLRKRNIQSMERKINLFKEGKISQEKFLQIFQGWSAYSNWANSSSLKSKFIDKIVLIIYSSTKKFQKSIQQRLKVSKLLNLVL